MKRITSAKKPAAPVQLTWSHLGVLYRTTAWPEVEFHTLVDGRWTPFEPNPASDIFSAAAVMLGRSEWRRYLEFVPARERSWLEQFTWHRLAALAVLTRDPALLDALEEAPALACFVGAHAGLRGGARPAWGEMQAVFERAGVYGLLEWLGLPASRDTVDALARLEDPDVPHRLLDRVREALWNPVFAASVRAAEAVTEVELAHRFAMIAA